LIIWTKSSSKLPEHTRNGLLECTIRDFTRSIAQKLILSASSHPSTSLPTLSSYLQKTHLLLNLILQIPPVDPSTSLRTSFFLRLTGEILSSIPGYSPDLQTVPELLDWLEDLDRAWLVVLRSQIWDPQTRTGTSILPNELHNHRHSSSMSQTERTRLRSLLITGTSTLEEWLETLGLDFGDNALEDESDIAEEGWMDTQTRINQLFSDTLTEMGILNGEMS
jgi:hypothetical protein